MRESGKKEKRGKTPRKLSWGGVHIRWSETLWDEKPVVIRKNFIQMSASAVSPGITLADSTRHDLHCQGSLFLKPDTRAKMCNTKSMLEPQVGFRGSGAQDRGIGTSDPSREGPGMGSDGSRWCRGSSVRMCQPQPEPTAQGSRHEWHHKA